jgi:hypothetical protein
MFINHIKISALLLTGLLLAGFRFALVNWVTVNEQSGRVTFSFPSGYDRYTASQTVYYSILADGLTYSVHVADTGSAAGLPGSVPQTGPITQNAPPSLDQFVTYLAQTTGGQVVSQQSVFINNRQGRDIDLNFTEPEGDQPLKMFVRLLVDNNRMYVFTLVAPVARTNDLTAARSVFFNSVNFY